MKVIDLLNKIANNEEVPNKIRVNETLYWFDDRQKQYIYVPNEKIASCDDIYSNTLILTYEPFDVLDEFLNAEVEIIEEDKKTLLRINKIIPSQNYAISDAENNSIDERFEMIRKRLYADELYMLDIANSLNELIDEVNKLKEGKDE